MALPTLTNGKRIKFGVINPFTGQDKAQGATNPFARPPTSPSAIEPPGLNPPPSGGKGGYQMPPPWAPPGTMGNMRGVPGQGATPFSTPGVTSANAPGGGAWWTPNPVGNAAGYAYAPRQFGADNYVDTSSAFYRQNMGAYHPSDPIAQEVWNAMPVQTQLELSSWARAGAGAFTDALMQAQIAGPTGIFIDGQYMAGNSAVEYIKQKARDYMSRMAQANQQSQPQPQATPFKVGLG